MELYLIDDYNEIYPELKNAALTDALVTDLLRDNGWVTDGEIRIERLPGGKPVLARDASGAPDDSGASGAREAAGDRGAHVHFSVSHTGHLFGCVISDAPVGLDIQMVTRANARRLAERYFTEAEIAWIEAGCETAPADDQETPGTGFRERFFRLWCRKEAYSKLTGEGLEVVMRKEPVVDRTDLEFTDLVLGDGIYGCICCK